MSGININARQRKVINIVLIGTAVLLLLGLIIDAAGAASPGLSRSDVAWLNKYEAADAAWRKKAGLPGARSKTYYSGFSLETFFTELIRSPRLYAAGLLIGLAVFIHRGPKDEKA